MSKEYDDLENNENHPVNQEETPEDPSTQPIDKNKILSKTNTADNDLFDIPRPSVPGSVSFNHHIQKAKAKSMKQKRKKKSIIENSLRPPTKL